MRGVCCLLLLLVLHPINATKKRRERTDKFVSVDVDGAVITGKRVRTGDSFIAGFTGIPYAESPTGQLRFSHPVKRTYIKGEKIDAAVLPPACLQNKYDPSPDFLGPQLSFSEDCLYLNVLTKQHWIEKGLKKPVLFYIHGGSFSNGDGISRDGSGLVEYADIVLVSVNYRLQLLGFLNSYDSIPANLGLWDVKLALEWVQNHIEAFGGDKKRVTIMGESAGGAIVTYLHTSPLTDGLFSSSISISGTMIAPWAFTKVRMEEQQGKWEILKHQTGCSNATDILSCLRSVNETTILDAMNATRGQFPIDTWPPIVDNKLVVDTPLNTIENGNYSNRPFLSGICQDEGSIMANAFALFKGVQLTNNSDKMKSKEQVRELSINHPLNKNFTMPCMNDNGDELLKFYTNRTDTDLKSQLSELLGDWLLFCPQVITADLFSKNSSSVYQYIFDYMSNNRKQDNSTWMGVSHGEDLAYLFGLPLSENSPFYNQDYNKQWGTKDRQISKIMMDMIEGFMRGGTPVVRNVRSRVCWDELGDKSHYLLVTNKKAGTKDLAPTIAHCQRMFEIVRTRATPCM